MPVYINDVQCTIIGMDPISDRNCVPQNHIYSCSDILLLVHSQWYLEELVQDCLTSVESRELFYQRMPLFTANIYH